VSSSAYSQQINMLQANEPKKIYEELSCTDIKKATSILKPLHDKNEEDGFVSLEVDPFLCDDTKATIKEGIRLHQKISFENLMIKIPATKAGYKAMEELTSLGIAVNATLVFSPKQAILCAKALDKGIKKSEKNTKAVISVFVSRFDRLLDDKISKLGFQTGTIGIINATKCYHKDTAPLDAIDSWEQDGEKNSSDILSKDECNKYFKTLKNEGIKIDTVYDELLQDGLESFKTSFKQLLDKVTL